MVAPSVRPIGVSASTAVILVTLESVFLGSLPTLALVATFIGPFVPLVTGGWSQRRARELEDVQLVYDPLYTEFVKNEDHIVSNLRWGQVPMFERDKIDQIRLSARYSLLRDHTPDVEHFCEIMDLISLTQGNANTTASRIIRETIHQNQGVLLHEGDGIALRGTNTEGSTANFSGSSWITMKLVLGIDPLAMFRQQGINITSMDIIDKNGNVLGSVPIPGEEAKYRFLWEIAAKKAKQDEEIMTLRKAVLTLPTTVRSGKKQLMDKVKKSRSSF
jgi:hypothetical protein